MANETFTIELPRFCTVPVKKVGESVVIDRAKMPVASLVSNLLYGETQRTNDAHASITKTGKSPFVGSAAEFHDAVMYEVNDCIGAMYSGTIGTRQAVDPETVARRFFESKLGKMSDAAWGALFNESTKKKA